MQALFSPFAPVQIVPEFGSGRGPGIMKLGIPSGTYFWIECK